MHYSQLEIITPGIVENLHAHGAVVESTEC
jgi:hypothetical protein